MTMIGIVEFFAKKDTAVPATVGSLEYYDQVKFIYSNNLLLDSFAALHPRDNNGRFSFLSKRKEAFFRCFILRNVIHGEFTLLADVQKPSLVYLMDIVRLIVPR